MRRRNNGVLPYPFGPSTPASPPNGGGVAIETAQAGDWFTSATWVGGVIPIIGNTITLKHAVTVSANAEVGNGIGGAIAIEAQAGGNLTINAGVTFTCYGRHELTNAQLTIGAGSIYQMAPGLGEVNALEIGTDHNQTSRVIVNGAVGNFGVIRKKPGALGNVNITGGVINGGQIVATHVKFEGINTFGLWLNSSTAQWLVEDFIFTGCGKITMVSGLNTNSHFRLKDGYFINSTGPDSIQTAGSTSVGTGVREIVNVTFDKRLYIGSINTTIHEVRCLDGFFSLNISYTAGLIENLYIYRNTSSNLSLPYGVTKGIYITRTGSNPHFFTVGTNGDSEIINLVGELEGTEENGDFFLPANPSVARVVNIHDSILLPNSNGRQSGTFLTCGGGANLSVKCNHNTYVATGGATGTLFGETYAGHAGMLQEFKSNIAYDPTGGSGLKLMRSVGSSVQDICAAANATHNTGWQLNPGSDGSGYGVSSGPNFFSAGGHGANDVDVAADPFVDRTRNLATWDASLGGPGTHANARAMMAVNTPGYTAQALLDYIFAGYVVNDATIQANGHDGADRGAARK